MSDPRRDQLEAALAGVREITLCRKWKERGCDCRVGGETAIQILSALLAEAVAPQPEPGVRPSDRALMRRAVSICERLKHVYNGTDVLAVYNELRHVRSYAGGGETWADPPVVDPPEQAPQ